MSNTVDTTFAYAGGYVQVRIAEASIYVTWSSALTTIIIEDSTRDPVDWIEALGKPLTGAALAAAQLAYARSYGVLAIGEWMEWADEQLTGEK